jgi:lipocalin
MSELIENNETLEIETEEAIPRYRVSVLSGSAIEVVLNTNRVFGLSETGALALYNLLSKPFEQKITSYNKQVSTLMETIRGIVGTATFTTVRVAGRSKVSFLNRNDSTEETMVIVFDGTGYTVGFMAAEEARAIAA